MTTENNRQYYCDPGKLFMEKATGLIMGDGIDLGIDDSIENYKEVDESILYQIDLGNPDDPTYTI